MTRSLAFVLVAFAGGSGIYGVVVGLVAVMFGSPADPSAIAFEVVLAFAGALVGLAQILRNRSGSDGWITLQAILAIGAIVGLAIVVALLATLIREAGGASPPPPAFLVLGAISAGGSIALGVGGRRSIQEAACVDDEAARKLMSRAFARVLPFEFAGIAACLVGIFLIVWS
jgi:hypothetical protein